jgi:vacuolar-type H+-ATPase subunit H
MTDHHHARPDDNPLQVIAQKERELEGMLERARHEAAGMVEAARREAEAAVAKAREEAAALAQDYTSRAEREALEIAGDVVGRARHEADRLRAQSEERMDVAVRLVVERIVGGAG